MYLSLLVLKFLVLTFDRKFNLRSGRYDEARPEVAINVA